VAAALFAVIAVVVALAVRRSTTGPSAYTVRAVFDNSSFVIPGEDVKVAGVKVGSITSVALTPDNKAAIVLSIDNRRYVPFRADAHCEIGLESLLGEQFVQCTPTQPRPAGASPPTALPAITSGAGKGEHLLPVQSTTAPIGIDLLADITRLPQQQRLQLVISGLGAGLAGNGQELNAALRRADPALQQTDQVIHTLAGENRTIARLIDQSDRILGPLTAQRAHIGGAIDHVGEVAQAAAAQGHAIEQNLVDFPPFLRQLTPAAQRLTALADQMVPALNVLGAQAPAINQSLVGLGPLTKASIPALKTLGNVAQRGEKVFPRSHDVVAELSQLGKRLVPLASDLAALSGSFDATGGIEDVMRFIYYYTGTVNGEDAISHYIRSSFEVGGCSARASSQGPGCGSTFATTTIAAAQARASRARASRARASRARVSRARVSGAAAAHRPPHGPAQASQPDSAMNTLIDYLVKP
jgi:ABC-type transporter Mla subunit MlaD